MSGLSHRSSPISCSTSLYARAVRGGKANSGSLKKRQRDKSAPSFVFRQKPCFNSKLQLISTYGKQEPTKETPGTKGNSRNWWPRFQQSKTQHGNEGSL